MKTTHHTTKTRIRHTTLNKRPAIWKDPTDNTWTVTWKSGPNPHDTYVADHYEWEDAIITANALTGRKKKTS